MLVQLLAPYPCSSTLGSIDRDRVLLTPVANRINTYVRPDLTRGFLKHLNEDLCWYHAPISCPAYDSDGATTTWTTGIGHR